MRPAIIRRDRIYREGTREEPLSIRFQNAKTDLPRVRDTIWVLPILREFLHLGAVLFSSHTGTGLGRAADSPPGFESGPTGFITRDAEAVS